MRILPPLTALSLVLLLHAAAWQGVAGDAPGRRSDLVVSAVQVRSVEAPAPALAAAAAMAAPPPRRAAAARAPSPKPGRSDTPTGVPVSDLQLAANTAAGSALPPAAPADAEPVPVYPTRMPPSVLLRFDLRRSGFSGRSELQWQNASGQYQTRLEGSVAGFRVFTWASQGRVDKDGLAPLRFTDQRRGKAEQAANFQREAGKITFSGPTTEYPLVPGAQDRLSWMIQLGAVLNARTAPPAAGERVSFFVVGAKGEGEVWHLIAQGSQTLTIQDQPTPAWRFLREPRKPHDSRVEVWLDPARHFLPVRYRQSTDGSNDVLDLVLEDMSFAS